MRRNILKLHLSSIPALIISYSTRNRKLIKFCENKSITYPQNLNLDTFQFLPTRTQLQFKRIYISLTPNVLHQLLQEEINLI